MRFFILDSLRGIAALWVFTFHYKFSDGCREIWPNLHAVFKMGYLGVPMFFVISGFCISASARSVIRKGDSTGDFLYRRMKRIYPPFWFSIAVVAALPFLMALISSVKSHILVMPTAEGNLNYGFLEYSWWEWVRLSILAQVVWPVKDASSLQEEFTSINAVYWTLAIEVQFYFVVAIVLQMSRKRFYSALLVVSLCSIPVAISGALMLSGVFLPFWPMFAVGILLFYVLERGWTPEKVVPRLATSIAFLVPMCAAGILGYAILMSLEPSSLVFAVAFAGVLWSMKPIDSWFADMNEHRYLSVLVRPFVMLGAMSYSLYLVAWTTAISHGPMCSAGMPQ